MNLNQQESKLSLLIVGAQKSGTSSLLSYLEQHPQLISHYAREFGYFIKDDWFQNGFQWAFENNYPSLNLSNDEPTYYIAKSVSVMMSETAVERAYQHNPQMRLVVLLRNPVERAYSSYLFARRNGWEDITTFEEAIFANPNRNQHDFGLLSSCNYFESGKYIEQINMVLKFFKREQISIFLFDAFKQAPLPICQQIYNSFPEPLNEYFPDVTKKKNPASRTRFHSIAKAMNTRGEYANVKKFVRKFISSKNVENIKKKVRKVNEVAYTPPPMNIEIRKELAERYRPYNEALSHLLNEDLSHWQ